ncbi:NUDIX hydrolase [[Pseudopropionibacterium] massiliense]|uniref:NUDIX hydrolase n=1 Tax=[Pseudopropionibacterium] massiliense TaxID=2220000 RepID=UPI001FE96EC5|nr:NUDIX domain-containing protein [[Pseudopropionibacterium] massiliense]
MKLPVMTVAVDIVVLTIADARLQVALVERGIPPYEGKQALPGGFVLPGESVMDAARRELVEETGLDLDTTHLEQLATFGEPGRDPRGRVVSVAHLALAASLGGLNPGSDASGARWCPVDDLPSLAFDHDEILRTGVERARAKLEYTTVATRFCGPGFTMTELRRVYEAAWDTTIDPRNFSRKVLGSRGFVIECGTRSGGRGRPAALYRAGTADGLHPPIMRED